MAPNQEGHSHRAHGKQSNKSFKSKHSTKSSLRDQAKGRTHRPATKDPVSRAVRAASTSVQAKNLKVNRKNHAKQVLAKKRELLEENKSIFNGKNKHGEKVQRVVAVVPMTEDVSAEQIVKQLADSIGSECEGVEGYRSVNVPKFHNQSLRFLLLPPASSPESLFPILDGASAADFVVIALSSEEEVTEQGETVLRSLTGLGVGGHAGGVLGVVKDLPGGNQTLASSTRASLQSFLTHFFPTVDRIHCVSSTPSAAPSSTMEDDSATPVSTPSPEATLIIRSLCEKTPKGLRWRENRPRVLAERVAWEKYETSGTAENGDAPSGFEGEELGTLVVEGVVRGLQMNANRLVHLQGYGDFKIDKILTAPSARPNKRAASAALSMALDSTASYSGAYDPLSIPDDDADSLASTNIPDDDEFGMDEQTWPTEEEMASAPAALAARDRAEMPPPALPGTTPKLKKVAKGTSAYQAAWIIDDEDDDDSGVDSDDEAMKTEDGAAVEDAEEEETEFVDTIADETATVSTKPFADLSPEQEEAQLQEYLASRSAARNAANLDDLDFPDEVDTPLHMPARERFARYRGLKSFRTSQWDPYEELPRDYGRCFMLEDWKGMGRRMEKRLKEDEGAEAGTRVLVYLANVPRRVVEEHNPTHPFVLFGLLKHEHKYSIMHFTVQRNTENSDTVRSKDPLVLQQGFRRFKINPIFSQHTVRNGGKGSNNVHKFERFLRHGIHATIATCYLPITFGSSPSLLLRVPTTSPTDPNPSPDQGIHLIGTGSLLASDPTRITAKRVILTGHPFKVHKKTATIRYLFFNREDVEYFKPVQLRTKGGRIGHIREPLGTHGYLKAGFDGPISQLDTICLTLYKRCFPKWGTVWDGKPLAIVSKEDVQAHAAERESVAGDSVMR
ncbi:small subunit rRNA maturation protein TSR1 [Sporobolomyces koalae]|uniref:small subunit rRNA maturation protein TSR1 n=1 Tax=Sporobolomyces koalae TaxID=500713 RepID=UPI00317C3AD8